MFTKTCVVYLGQVLDVQKYREILTPPTPSYVVFGFYENLKALYNLETDKIIKSSYPI